MVAYGRIIPARLLEQIPMVNLHFSLLPRWRGAAPVERAILAGDHETGVCLMKVEEGLDTGPVYAVRTVPLDDDITLAALRAELVAVASALVVDALAGGVAGLPDPVPQEGEVTMADKISKEDLHLDWTRPAVELKRVVRLGRAWTTFRGKRLTVLDVALGPGEDGAAGRSTRFARRARSSRRVAGAWCCNRCSPRAVLPCQPTSGCGACGPRSASGSGRSRHEGGDRDSDRRVEPRPVRAVPFGTSAAVRRPAHAVPPRPGRAHRRSRVRHRGPDQDPARGDGGRGDRRRRLVPGHAGPGAVGLRRRAPGSRSRRATSRRGSTKGSTWCSPTRRSSGSTTTSTCWRACAPRSAPTGSWPSRCRPTTATPRTCWRRRWPTSPRSSMRSTGTCPRTAVASCSRPSSTPISSTSWARRIRSCAWRSTATSSSRRARSSNGSWARCSRRTARGLSPELFDAFVERYRERLIEELGEREPYFYGFRRILCWARFS